MKTVDCDYIVTGNAGRSFVVSASDTAHFAVLVDWDGFPQKPLGPFSSYEEAKIAAWKLGEELD
jgi:hypothetical protein